MGTYLIMDAPDGRRRTFEFDRPIIVLGRGERCHLRVPLEGISRKHCQIERRGRRHYLVDLVSANGTYLNNLRVAGERRIRSGDVLTIGNTSFSFRVSSQDPTSNSEKSTPLDDLMVGRPSDDGPASSTESSILHSD